MNEKLVIPNHIGIIMDGNGRWAEQRGLRRSLGHREGANTLKKICLYAESIGVKYLSVYAFSTENFKRSKIEVDFLMNLFIEMFTKEFEKIMAHNVKVVFSGRRLPLAKKVLSAMDEIVDKTKNNTSTVLNICLNYGGQTEILDMTKKIAEMVQCGNIQVDNIDFDTIRRNLYQDLPPLDYVIRTSGELRLSNFMLYQASYAEFYFPKILFPDFLENEFMEAIVEFNRRTRKFGGNV